jgi:hypothetical protein
MGRPVRRRKARRSAVPAPDTDSGLRLRFGRLWRELPSRATAVILRSAPGTAPGRPRPGSQRHDRHHLAAGPRVRQCRRPGPLPDRRPRQPAYRELVERPAPAPRPGSRPARRVPHPGCRHPDARPGQPVDRSRMGQRPGPHRHCWRRGPTPLAVLIKGCGESERGSNQSGVGHCSWAGRRQASRALKQPSGDGGGDLVECVVAYLTALRLDQLRRWSWPVSETQSELLITARDGPRAGHRADQDDGARHVVGVELEAG